MRAREFSFGTNLYLSGPGLTVSERCLGHQLFFYLIVPPTTTNYLGFHTFSLVSFTHLSNTVAGESLSPWPP